MIPSGNSYRVLRLLLFSAVDVGQSNTMRLIGNLHNLCHSDSSQVSEAKIVYALETGTSEEQQGQEEGEGDEKGLEGYMKLQIEYVIPLF